MLDGDEGIPWGGTKISYIFDLLIDSTTLADVYDLEFATAGKLGDRWYQDEHLYLQVVPEPGTVLLLSLGVALLAGYAHRKRSD